MDDAGVAHQVEHIIRNDGVVGSSPITGTILQINQYINMTAPLSHF